MDTDKYNYLVPNVFLFTERNCFPDWVITKNQNSFHDLTFVIAGKANYFVNEVKYTVEAGDLIYIPSGSTREAHTFKDNPMKSYPFNFYWNEPHNSIHLPFGMVTKNLITKEILDHIREFKHVWMNQQPFYMIQARALLQSIIYRLLTNYYRQSAAPVDPRIKKVMNYIADHYADSITIGKLAARVGLHPVYLGKLFKQHTGSSCKEYINRIRINNAEMMLSSGDFTVTETAERCGFQDISYFSNLFKAMKGYPPSAARG
ncbi:AraC family transcriptional regulator [Paenibacillus sp. SYP-B4298]|uniref:AraC family transcriptional regulator n=1 Tax=Paenibacillus sp. SYP-B4298 TaxID=2996034 RepID=UPI0022DD0842|nr:AraC family transcriptional regulator [Paenibacillus sp. SYP-B4298]